MKRDRILSQGLPANLEAERLVLGSILLNGDLFTEIGGCLDGEDFSLESHRRIFAHMRELYDRGERIDRITVFEELRRHGLVESCGGLSYLVSLDDGLPQIAHLDAYVRIVKEKSIRRRAVGVCDRLIDQLLGADPDSGEVLDRAQRLLHELGAEQSFRRGMRTPGEIIDQFPGGVNGFLEPDVSNPGIKTPWPSVNRLIGGLWPGQLALIAARPGVGKTASAMQIAEYAASRGTGLAVFSLEMSAEQILQRMICAKAGVDSHRFRQGHLGREDRERVAGAASRIASLPIFIDDTAGCTVPALHASIRKLRARHPIGLVVVDYLQLMDTVGRRENRNQEITQISRGLKLAAKEFGVPFLVMAQLNRAPEAEKRRPVLSDLRESGSLEQDADLVIFIHQPEMQKGGSPGMAGQAEFIVAKQRNGPRGKVDMLFIDRYVRFEEPVPRERVA